MNPNPEFVSNGDPSGTGIGPTDGEMLLPEAIIQHIQSFLSGKEAAQTSILSKTWFSAWSTRPQIDFDQRDFGNEQAFEEFARRTMERYESLNLKIESFWLWMTGRRNLFLEDYGFDLADELTAKAAEIGATDLKLGFPFRNPASSCVLPPEVLRSEALTRLSLSGCRIDVWSDEKVRCSRLISLCLSNVYMKGDVIWGIISSCPLIEELSLSGCQFLSESKSSDVLTTTLLVLTPLIEFGRQMVGPIVHVPVNYFVFHNLNSLLLDRIHVDTLFFRDFSLKFPCLKVLTLHLCTGLEKMVISSSSLESIILKKQNMVRGEFDVPSICKFNVSGSFLPSLFFITASRECRSEISVTCNINSLWFLRLKRFLIELNPSKISLTLTICTPEANVSAYPVDTQVLPQPTVENVTLLMDDPSSVCPALFEGLFWSCRPKYVALHWLRKSCVGRKADNDFLELLCKTIVTENTDVKEVIVQVFEENLGQWLPLSWETLLDASTDKKIRFHLRWDDGL